MKTRWLLISLALLSLLAQPLLASARQDRDNRGESRIIVHDGDGTVVLDEEDIERLLESLDALGPQIEKSVQEALEGLDSMDFDFGGDEDFSVDWDEDEWAEWSERLGKRMAALSERLSERLERTGRAHVRVRAVHSQHQELQEQIGELEAEIRRLTRELDELRKGGED